MFTVKLFRLHNIFVYYCNIINKKVFFSIFDVNCIRLYRSNYFLNYYDINKAFKYAQESRNSGRDLYGQIILLKK